MSRHFVVHTDWHQHPLSAEDVKILADMDIEVVRLEPRNNQEFLKVAPKVEAVLNADFPITESLLTELRTCRLISRYGTGVNNIDVHAATRFRIPVANVPDFCSDAVATRTMLLLLACSCRLLELDRYTREARWGLKDLPFAPELQGKVLGLVGFGKISRAVSVRARSFGLEIVAYDPYISEGVLRDHGVKKCDLDTLLRASDFVSLHLPLNQQTKHLLSSQELGLMKPTGVLINTARGALVDEKALVDALQQGRLHAVGLDAFESEPPDRNHPFFAMKNVVMTPHCAAHTREATERVRRAALNAVVAIFDGEHPRHVVNPEVFKKTS